MPRSLPKQQASRQLEALRIRAGLTQRGLAAAAGLHSTTILQAERGRVPSPPTQKAIAIALSSALSDQITPLDLWPMLEPRTEAAA